jgi:hypothetical protein
MYVPLGAGVELEVEVVIRREEREPDEDARLVRDLFCAVVMRWYGWADEQQEK